MHFLKPSAAKLKRTLIVAAVLPGAFVLTTIPHEWDLLDLRLIGRGILAGLLGGPIRLLDWMTDRAFASRSEAFIVFPTLPQVGFALACDALLFYLVACAWVTWRSGAGRGAG